MRKRIFWGMMTLMAICLVLAVASLCFVFYGQFAGEVRAGLRGWTQTFAGQDSAQAASQAGTGVPAGIRVSIVAPDGDVIYDNTVDASALPSHLDREEIDEALTYGVGESVRFSSTLGTQTFYYSIRLADGYILRAAKTASSVFSIFLGAWPVVLAVVLAVAGVGYILAGRLTGRIVRPINEVDLTHTVTAPYDELAPFVRTIEKQRQDIDDHLKEIQAAAATTRAITESMAEGILLIDRQGQVLSANKSAAGVAGDDVLEGRHILELFRSPEWSQHTKAALAGERGEMNYEKTGRVYRVFFSPAAAGGAMILLLDTTEKAQAERMRREFSANVSHELKTPLTGIYGHAEMLTGGMVKTEDLPEFYQKIQNEAARMIALVEDIIFISKLDENQTPGTAAREEADILQIAEEVAEALAENAEKAEIALRCEGQSTRVLVNHALVFELLYNLVDNAVKYGRPGGSASICVQPRGEKAEITVTDTGIGIPPEAQGRVFERFYRVEPSRAKKSGGTGLGLAIVKHIVQLHGGEIDLKSQPGQGTTITVRI